MTITDRMAAWRRERRALQRAAWRLEQAEQERACALASARAERVSIHTLPAGDVEAELPPMVFPALYTDLGPDYVASRTDRDTKIRNHVRQLQALGLEVTLTPAA